MSIFGEFFDTPPETPSPETYRIARAFCMYCADPLDPNEPGYLRDKQYCRFCGYVYGFNPFFMAEVMMSDGNGEIKKETKEEKYRRVFNYKKESLTVAQMDKAALIEHIHLLESTLEDLLFEKRTEIAASRDRLEDMLEGESENERERYRRMDRDGRTKRMVADAEAREAKPERKAPRSKDQQMMDSLMKIPGMTEDAARAIMAKKA